MRNFIVQFLTCDCLISKFVSKFCVGGLGSFGRTVMPPAIRYLSVIIK